eukprot:1928328-Rhodomonas_salina.1
MHVVGCVEMEAGVSGRGVRVVEETQRRREGCVASLARALTTRIMRSATCGCALRDEMRRVSLTQPWRSESIGVHEPMLSDTWHTRS